MPRARHDNTATFQRLAQGIFREQDQMARGIEAQPGRSVTLITARIKIGRGQGEVTTRFKQLKAGTQSANGIMQVFNDVKCRNGVKTCFG